MKNKLQTILLSLFIIAIHSTVTAATYAGCSDAGIASATEDSICDNASTTLLLTAYIGTIQWQSYDGVSWVNETGPGATTDNYTVALLVSTNFRAVVTDGACPPDTSNTVSIIVGVSAPSTTGATRCGYGSVTLTASGSSGTIKWFDAPTGGTSLFTGSPYTTNVAATTTFYAAAVTGGGGSGTAPLPAQVNIYTAQQSRGFWFTAPMNFTLTGLFVPVMTGTEQNIAVIKFIPPVPPPAWPTLTSAFTTLFLTQNNPAVGVIPVNIPILAGDVIGILGTRTVGTNNETSYGPAPSAYVTTIAGQPVTLTRMGMQFPLSTTLPVDIWEEPAGSLGRIEMTYEVGCESARTPAIATVNPSTPVNITATSTALCLGQSSVLTANSTNLSYNFTWSPATGLSGTTGTTVTATPTFPITYTVVADDGTCGAIDSVFIDVGPVSNAGIATVTTDTVCQGTNTTLVLAGSVGNIQWQSNTGLGWVNETGIGFDSSQYQVAPMVNTNYWAIVTSGGCAPDTSIMLHVEVITVADPVTVNDTICGPGVVNLSATGTGTLNWYDAQVGGAQVNTGNNYSPSISTTTTYYVQNVSGGGNFNLPPANNSMGNQNINASNDFGLGFDVLQQVNLDKVYVYPSQTGNITINLRATQGGLILNTVTAPVTAFVPLTPINLGWTINPGTGYRLELAAGGAQLYYNSNGAAYPYTIPGGLVSITGYLNPVFTTGTIYYYFYNWEITSGCESNLIPVTGVVLTVPPVPIITQFGNQLTSSSPTGNQWYLNGIIIPGATGQIYNATQPGTYTVVVTDPNGCSSTSAPVIITGIEESILNEVGISIYPNPVTDKLMIEFNKVMTGETNISIFNALGEKVKSVLMSETKMEIGLDVPAGTYAVEIKTHDAVYTARVLKL